MPSRRPGPLREAHDRRLLRKHAWPRQPASCYLVQHDGFRLVLDLGHGSVGALQRHLALNDIDAISLSHLHPDHCIDMTALYVAHQYGNLGFDGPLPGLRTSGDC